MKTTLVDLIVILVYFAGMVYVGYYFKENIKNPEDFYVAGRTLPPFVIMATVCATIIGGGAMIGRGGVTYNQGAVSLTLAFPYLIGMYVFSAISGRIHNIGVKYGVASIPGLMKLRFGTTAGLLVSLLIAFTMMATVGTQVTAMATIFKAIGGEYVSYETGAWLGMLTVVVYTAFSGLFGVVYTDVAQFIVLITLVYTLLPIMSVMKIGGIDAFIHAVPVQMWSLQPDGQIIGWIVTSLVFTMAGAEMWQRAFAARSAQAAQKGMFLGTTVYFYSVFITVIIGLSAYILLPNLNELYGSGDAAVPALVIEMLPPYIRGLALAGLFAVLMSTADTYILVSVQTITKDIGKTVYPAMSLDVELKLARVCTFVVGIGAVLVALSFRQAYAALMFSWTFYASAVGLPALAALYWEKATRQGIISAIVSGFLVSAGWGWLGNPWEIGPSIPGSVVCGIILVLVSLATYRKNRGNAFPV